MTLFDASYNWWRPIRSLGLRACNLEPSDRPRQLTIFTHEEERMKKEKLAHTIDGLRRRFGPACIHVGTVYWDRELSEFDPKEEHVIHPTAFFK